MSIQMSELLLSNFEVTGQIFTSDISYDNTLVYERNTVTTVGQPEIIELDFTPVLGFENNLDGHYFKLYDQAGSGPDVYFWWEAQEGSAGDPSPSGLGSPVSISIGFPFTIHDATRNAIDAQFGALFSLSAEGGDVLTVTNAADGAVTDPVNDPMSPVMAVVTQQGVTASTVTQPVNVPPVAGPFDYTTLQITRCPALGNITAVDMFTGNVTYEPPMTSGPDVYEYTLTDTEGFVRQVNQTMSQVQGAMPPMVNNCCETEDNISLVLDEGPLTFGPYNFSVLDGGNGIDWTTVEAKRFQLYIQAPPDEGPPGTEPDLVCSANYPFGTSEDTSWDPVGTEFDQTPPYSQDEGPPIQDPTVISGRAERFPGDQVTVTWIDNEDGTYSIQVGSFDVFSWDVEGFGVKVTITVQDNLGMTSNEGCCRILFNPLAD